MTNEITNFDTAKALAACTGSVEVTVCDDANGAPATYNRKDELKAELVEVMVIVESRKAFYNRVLKSLQNIYAIEKDTRASVKAGTATREDLAEVMAIVMSRKKFYNRALASLQSIYVIEKQVRTSLKALKEQVV